MPERFPLEELASLPSFYHPTASPDGDRVAFYWDTTGRNELYVMDADGTNRRRVSDGEVPRDARHGIRWDADGERVLFHRDQDGDEQNDVHALTLDGDHQVLVEMDGQCTIEDPSPDGRYLYFTSSAGRQKNAYRLDHETGEVEQLTDYDQPVMGVYASPDGERIAYTANESDDLENRDVYVADADGSNPRNLDVGEEGYEATVADWLPDGSGLLVGDDTPGMNRVGVYSFDDDAVEWFSDGESEERPVGVLDGDRLLAVRLREAAVMPLVYDRDGESRELDLPEGVASFSGGGDGSLLADGSVLAFHTTPDRRQELVRYDLATDEYETLIEADYGDIDPDTFVDAEYVTYESEDGTEIGALLYDSGERPSPAVVEVHGGPHGQSMKRFSPYTQFLVNRGYTVLQPNYRGSIGRGREFKNAVHDDWGGMEQVDVREGARWLKERDWIDDDRVAVYGGSYGGYSAYCQLTMHPEEWTTGVAWVGMTDLHLLYEEGMPHFKTGLEQQMGDPEENHDLWRERSPVEHVENVTAPVGIVHGVNDPRCPISQARVFRDALEERGWEAGEDGDFEYYELSEEGHGSSDIDQKIRAFRIMEDYLERRLKDAPRASADD